MRVALSLQSWQCRDVKMGVCSSSLASSVCEAGSECRLLGHMLPSPWVANPPWPLRWALCERITSTRKGSITSVQAITDSATA